MGHIVWPPDAGQLLFQLLRQGLGVKTPGLQRALPPGPASREQMGGLFFWRGQQRHHESETVIKCSADRRMPIECSG